MTPGEKFIFNGELFVCKSAGCKRDSNNKPQSCYEAVRIPKEENNTGQSLYMDMAKFRIPETHIMLQPVLNTEKMVEQFKQYEQVRINGQECHISGITINNSTGHITDIDVISVYPVRIPNGH